MDNLTRRIADFAAELSFEQLPEDVVSAATRFLIDTLACAIAAHDCESARIGLDLARGTAPQRYPGRILFHGEKSTAESAAFVNTAMIRNLDFNDQYPGGHPSDCLGAFLALAEAAQADGRRLIEAMVIAYELFVRISDATGLRYKEWDQGFAIGICTAAGVGHLLGLTPQQIGEAVAITAVANVPMRNTRAGELSLWKGAATSFATRNGVFAALLAGQGMTGPDRPFEGKHGLWDIITGPFEFEPLPTAGGPYRSPDVQLKAWPVEYNAQLPVWAALELRSKVDWRALTDIDIGTYTFAFTEIGGEPEKWDPQTRETADHSMPYIFARVLLDGAISVAAFDQSAYRDPAIRPLMNRIHIRLDNEVNAMYPNVVAMKVKATTKDGRLIELFPRDPLGHSNNSMNDQDVREKFTRTVEPVYGREKTATVLERWWRTNQLSAAEMTGALSLLDFKS
ncbi:MAG: MmgE/PrpD family protein [Deltaproteobacteria bacterium]|nr:MmgE/PrpD family protein [Deltaproteobacteria bacterium]